MMKRAAKIAFVHGRPGPHSFHAELAKAVGAEFIFVDRVLRSHDLGGASRRYLSWIVNAFVFPHRRTRPAIIMEGVHFPPVLMKFLRLLSPNQPVIALLDNETLYFLHAQKYGRLADWAHRRAIAMCDAIACVGAQQTALAHELVAGRSVPRILTIPSAISNERMASLATLEPDLTQMRVLFVGSGPGGWRTWYKGLDLLVEAVARVRDSLPVTLTIVGEWTEETQRHLFRSVSGAESFVTFAGKTAELRPPMASAGLYVHLGRGEAFGISVLEAMRAGLPAIVSEWTGAREAVERVDARLVVSLNADAAAKAISSYFGLELEARRALSRAARAVAAAYTLDRARHAFSRAVDQVIADCRESA